MSQIIKFRCVACGHRLGEKEYYVAYEELRIAANKIEKQKLDEHISELKGDFLEIKERARP